MKAKISPDIARAEEDLDAFDAARRRAALRWLAERIPAAPETRQGIGARSAINLHAHSFFSYNTLGYSPTHIAWEARRAGLYAVGLCDFDVLDGLDEFLDAGLALRLRATVNVETRAFLREYAAVEINSPGEPGVAYVMGAGFVRQPAIGSPEANTLANYRRQAAERNAALVERINARLPQIAIAYERDVLPLSPGACPTERHIVRAYRLRAERAFGGADATAAFWAGVMGKPAHELARPATDAARLEEVIRAKLVKKGGFGYETPTERTFPPADDFFNWVLGCEAVPMATWLDGASTGEADMDAMLECLAAKGAAAVNLIPDRNHNVQDTAARALKLKKLDEVMRAAERRSMPINIGTELNKDGQPFHDDLECAALKPYADTFLRGARILVGHTWLSRYGSYAYVGAAARQEFGRDTIARNALFEAVGGLPAPDVARGRRLEDLGPLRALTAMRDSARCGRWTL